MENLAAFVSVQKDRHDNCTNNDLSEATDAAIASMQYSDEDRKECNNLTRPFPQSIRFERACPTLASFVVPNRSQATCGLKHVLDEQILRVVVHSAYFADWMNTYLAVFCKHFNRLSGKDGVVYGKESEISCEWITADWYDVFAKLFAPKNVGTQLAMTFLNHVYPGTNEPCSAENNSEACPESDDCSQGRCRDRNGGTPLHRRFVLSCPLIGSDAVIITKRIRWISHQSTTVPFVVVGLLLFLAIAALIPHLCNCMKAPTVTTEFPGSDDVSHIWTAAEHVHNTGEAEHIQRQLRALNKFLVAFINSGSGDQKGSEFELLLRRYLGDSGLVCKLPHDLETGFEFAAQNSPRKQVIFMVCGGDGTVSWILSELQKRRAAFDVVPAVGILPMGTGNDLARSLGWGPAFTDNRDLATYIFRAIYAEPVLLDQWKLSLEPDSFLPPSLIPLFSEKLSYVGYFTNYFSVGMDAQTTHEVARARHTGMGKFCFRCRCCRPCRFVHGGLFCYLFNAPNPLRCFCCRTRPLNKDLDMQLDGDTESFRFESEVRQVTFTNLNSYGAGMQLYDKKISVLPEHLVSPRDWRLEMFTLKGPGAVVGMAAAKKVLDVSCCSIPVSKQPNHVRMKLQKGQFFQMDGEPWILTAGCTATIQPSTRVRMLCPQQIGPGAGIWDRQKRTFWEVSQESASQDTEQLQKSTWESFGKDVELGVRK
eukprot:TRINITY_DN72575_c0_g1_i1.p1 TRINITY_DN72575_c0_g1~~TRINITY_DN72575_c0_g1_i1.p1  ORF type:complete len:829 (-),score=62.65 TRINITY_DN72575_c0_g1_i1:331-2451(-)